ncbi:unnamed protein product [Ilex paraguariensis]|uniref:beta-fructofuranosidase n=1 Tax=Ilex paraguariensis TaxID=185542 RepID=A0ABC8TUL3_9AQUA
MLFSNPFRSDSESDDTNTALPYSYRPLSDETGPTVAPAKGRRPIRIIVLLLTGLLAVGLLVALMSGDGLASNGGSEMVSASVSTTNTSTSPGRIKPVARGIKEGVSAKSFVPLLGVPQFPWTREMLAWQRTAFHFQPKKNWMNGPLFYKGWYHFFYQYNPKGAVWGDIVWGHAVSRDLIHWRHLPIAMVCDHWYDINGVWTGSATILPDGQVVMLYTGSTNESVQVQNLAYPANLSDPFLIDWVKYSGNPVLVPPPGIKIKDFRDPTTAWYRSDGTWRLTIGSKVNKTGISLVYETKDFKTYELLDGVLHGVPGTGMWECVDFYPVSKIEANGLDTSDNGAGVKHVVKASLDDDRNDYYALGTYDDTAVSWIPDDPKVDVGIGLRYDYGIFYASKTFYDEEKRRRVLWGWIKESDSESTDVKKGWSSVQAIPRTVLFDKKTGSNLLQWPVDEVNNLRSSSREFNMVTVESGSIVKLVVDSADQLDIMAEFEIDKEALETINGTDDVYDCSAAGGAAKRGALGPFGISVLADKDLSEQTTVYYYVAKGADGNLKTLFCSDQSRSSEATDVDKAIYGSTVPVLKGEKLSMRTLVDHSIVESFAQGGRTCITSRVYPTKAINGDAQLFLFNNATEVKVTASLKIWKMNSAYIHTGPTEMKL